MKTIFRICAMTWTVAASVQAAAADYLTRPVRFIVPFPPGGGNPDAMSNSRRRVRTAHAQLPVKGTLEAKQNGAQCAPYGHFVRAEREKGECVIKAAGIKMQ